MIKTAFILFLLSISTLGFSQSRLSDEMKAQEEELNASSKQLNQFFRRFNGEESEKGKRYFEGDRKYRDNKLRSKFIPVLFDNQSGISPELAKEFIGDVLNNEVFLNLHVDGLVAEVSSDYSFGGRRTGMLMFMKIQEQGQGSEWVLDNISFGEFSKRFPGKDEEKPFIHPMSHELQFMNLKKAFKKGAPINYTPDNFKPDYLTLFLYELNRGNLEFQGVNGLKYHFFEIPGWYIEVANFNRSGMNSGWLISNLVKVNKEQKSALRAYIYGE